MCFFSFHFFFLIVVLSRFYYYNYSLLLLLKLLLFSLANHWQESRWISPTFLQSVSFRPVDSSSSVNLLHSSSLVNPLYSSSTVNSPYPSIVHSLYSSSAVNSPYPSIVHSLYSSSTVNSPYPSIVHSLYSSSAVSSLCTSSTVNSLYLPSIISSLYSSYVVDSLYSSSVVSFLPLLQLPTYPGNMIFFPYSSSFNNFSSSYFLWFYSIVNFPRAFLLLSTFLFYIACRSRGKSLFSTRGTTRSICPISQTRGLSAGLSWRANVLLTTTTANWNSVRSLSFCKA